MSNAAPGLSPSPNCRATAPRQGRGMTEHHSLGRRGQFVNAVRADVRFGLRALRRSPWMTIVAILVLALGLGATVTMYSAIAGVVLRPLPFTRPSELVSVGTINASQTTMRAGASVPDFRDWRVMTNHFAGLAAF